MSVDRHAFGYGPTKPAPCKAPNCPNGDVARGALRYAEIEKTSVKTTVKWRHWGCVTSEILQQLSLVPLENVRGFKELSPQDQYKVRRAVGFQHVAPADLPGHSVGSSTSSTPASNGALPVAPHSLKRKEVPDPEQGLDEGGSQLRFQAHEEEGPNNELGPMEELYCQMRTQIVGIQYYDGLVAVGQQISLIREPDNQYDSNAIQVKNVSNIRVGHLPRGVAAKLAPLMDHGLVTVEGDVLQSNMGRQKMYNLDMNLKIYGAPDKRAVLEPLLIWATPGQRGFSDRAVASTSSGARPSPFNPFDGAQLPFHDGVAYPYAASTLNAAQSKDQHTRENAVREAFRKAAELREMLDTLNKVDDDGRRGSLLDTLCAVDDVLGLPEYPDPPSIGNKRLRVDLLKHQKQALQWCMDREHPKLPTKESEKPVQFWQLRQVGSGHSYYFNVATNTPSSERPVLPKGALCADAMGLGKTLTMIALILETKQEKDTGFCGATLIVLPVSVQSNWEKQIRDHCQRGALKYYVHTGQSRHTSKANLEKYDVVLTTYSTVAMEYADPEADHATKKKRIPRALFDVDWKRIILDEGHVIRNPKTKQARACTALSGSRRWVLTGTPILNSPRDLGSILSFLKICQPLDKEEYFNRLVLRPLMQGDPKGADLLKAVMAQICLRRTKEMQDSSGKPLVSLPPVEMIRVPVAMTDEARALYDRVEELSGERIHRLLESGRARVQSNALSLLTRLRQIALHPGLVPADYVHQLELANAKEDEDEPTQVITPEQRQKLQSRLAQAVEDSQECAICFNPVTNDPRITPCGHVYCLVCITNAIARDPRCPYDRSPLSSGDLLEPPASDALSQKALKYDYEEAMSFGTSAKINQLVRLLQVTPEHDKILVFSQFTSFLDKIGEALLDAKIPFLRLDGKMSEKRREEAISRFSVPLDSASCSDDELSSESEYDSDSPFGTRKVNPRVMLLSLKAGAVGLNLTVANHVFLMDPWWQEGIESQAVDRVNRIGQKKKVHVYQLISENTVEARVLEIQERKKQLIEHAFSGIKRVETQREQHLLELFNVRRKDMADDSDDSGPD